MDDYRDLLGKVPDRVIADIAGMSLGAVRNFRIKQDIEPAGRMRPSEIEAIVATFQAGEEALPPEPMPPVPQPVRRAPAAPKRAVASATDRAWRCRTVDGRDPFVIVAESLAQAAERAVAVAGGDQRIASIENLGTVLAS